MSTITQLIPDRRVGRMITRLGLVLQRASVCSGGLGCVLHTRVLHSTSSLPAKQLSKTEQTPDSQVSTSFSQKAKEGAKTGGYGKQSDNTSDIFNRFNYSYCWTARLQVWSSLRGLV